MAQQKRPRDDEFEEYSEMDSESGVTNPCSSAYPEKPDSILSVIFALTSKVNAMDAKLDAIKGDHCESSNRLCIIEDQHDHMYGDMARMSNEQRAIRADLDLMKSIVIKQDETISTMNRRIVDLEARSMRSNVLIHGIGELQNENVTSIVHKVISQLGFKQTLEIERAHRLGMRQQGLKQSSRIIVVKFLRYTDAVQVIDAGRNLPKGAGLLRITPQLPTEWVEKRRELGRKADKARESDKNATIKITKDKLYINHELQKDDIPTPTTRELFESIGDDYHRSDNIGVSDQVFERGSSFQAVTVPACSMNDVKTAYKLLSADPQRAMSTHNICIYGLPVKSNKKHSMHYGYNDNGEFGAGRAMIRELTKPEFLLPKSAASGFVSVITRAYGGTHLGPRRFEIMKDVLLTSLSRLNTDSAESDLSSSGHSHMQQDADVHVLSENVHTPVDLVKSTAETEPTS